MGERRTRDQSSVCVIISHYCRSFSVFGVNNATQHNTTQHHSPSLVCGYVHPENVLVQINKSSFYYYLFRNDFLDIIYIIIAPTQIQF